MFRHALLQKAAYETLLRDVRPELHRRTAEALEALFPLTVRDEPEVLAHHWTEAGNAEKAVVANCSAVREWDSNGTNFGFNPEETVVM